MIVEFTLPTQMSGVPSTWFLCLRDVYRNTTAALGRRYHLVPLPTYPTRTGLAYTTAWAVVQRGALPAIRGGKSWCVAMVEREEPRARTC